MGVGLTRLVIKKTTSNTIMNERKRQIKRRLLRTYLNALWRRFNLNMDDGWLAAV